MKSFLFNDGDEPEVDEYELVDAFDFAGDNDEHDLQNRLIDYALRRYSDFQPLLIRKALLLIDDGQREQALDYAKRVSEKMPLRQIFSLLLDLDEGLDTAKAFERLEAIIAEHTKLNDEEMIRLIDTAMDLDGGYDWLITHLDTLRTKLDYLPTLLFEMAQNAREVSKPEDAERFIDELTMVEPFEIDYWEMLAEVHIALGKNDEATSDLEYAAAINPHSPRTRLLRAHVEIQKGADPEVSLHDIEDIVFSDILGDIPLSIAVASLDAAKKPDTAADYLYRFLEKFPLSIPAIDMLLYRKPIEPRTKEILEYFYQHNPQENTEFFWRSWAEHHFSASNYDGTIALLTTFMSHASLSSFLVLALAYYYTNRASDVIALMYEYIKKYHGDDATQAPNSAAAVNTTLSTLFSPLDSGIDPAERPMLMTVFIMSLVRTSNDAVLPGIIASELLNLPQMMSQGDIRRNLLLHGYKSFLETVMNALNTGIYPDEYDPLLNPGNLPDIPSQPSQQ